MNPFKVKNACRSLHLWQCYCEHVCRLTEQTTLITLEIWMVGFLSHSLEKTFWNLYKPAKLKRNPRAETEFSEVSMPDCLLTCFWLVCLFVYRLLFGDLYFQHTELHFEHILQELLEMAGGRERATTWFLLREPSKARRGLERPSRDTSPSKCAAKLM